MSDDQPRTCLACGITGTDVSMALVRYDDPQPVEVAIPVATDRRGRVAGNDIRRVPGRFGSEWRCRDHAACAARVAAQQPKGNAPW